LNFVHRICGLLGGAILRQDKDSLNTLCS